MPQFEGEGVYSFVKMGPDYGTDTEIPYRGADI